MKDEDGRSPSGRATAVEPVPVSPLRDGIPSADDIARSWLVRMTKQGEDNIWRGADQALAAFDGMRSQLGYLREHHHITESMVGIMLLHATSGQRKAVQHYSDQLDLLHINRLLDCGVPAENIGERGIFFHPDHLVAQAIETRRAETQSGSVHESAVPEGCAPTSPSSPTNSSEDQTNVG